ILDQLFTSPNARYSLVLQSDGNLVHYDGTTPLWATYTTKGSTAVMQGDGNFVLYDEDSVPVFNTGTFGHPGAALAVQDDGNLVIYAGSTALWASGTAGR